MQTVHIDIHKGWGDCEDCGFYDWANFKATFSDGSTLQGDYDGHLGGGNWDGQLSSVLLWCLQRLGYRVEQPNEEDLVQPYRVRSEDEYRDWREEPLFPGEPVVLRLDVVERADTAYPDYTYPVHVTLPAPRDGGTRREFRFIDPEASDGAGNWDGDWTRVYLALLEQVATVTVNETQESDD